MSSLYSNALGDEFHQLSPILQRFHTAQDKFWNGEAFVNWSTNPLLRLILRLGGLPKQAKRLPVTVSVVSNINSELWLRRFGNQQLRSRQKLIGESLHECFGPVSLALDNLVEQGALQQSCSHSSLFGVTLPRRFNVSVTAREWQEDERFHFDVEISLANRSLIRYRGWLRPQGREA